MRLLVATGTSQGKNLRLVPDKEGNIPLLCAIEIGNVPVARELLLSSTQVFSENTKVLHRTESNILAKLD